MLEVVDPGFLSTVQDAGRPGSTDLGVSVGGACDTWSMAVANLLAGNHPGDAVLEITLGGPELVVLRRCVIALAGADLGARVIEEARPITPGTAHLVHPGTRIGFGGGGEGGENGDGGRDRSGAGGARAYLAVAGGIDVPPILGSRATSLAGAFGGIDGRPLRRGDRIVPGRLDDVSAAGRSWPAGIPLRRVGESVGLLLAPRTPARPVARAYEALLATPWRIASASDRQGLRLEGPALPVDARIAGLLLSRGVIPGAVQAPLGGSPIVLLVDGQTVGGYPVAGVVPAADLPILAQLRPGASLQFVATTMADALAARRAQRASLLEAAGLLAATEDWHAIAEGMA